VESLPQRQRIKNNNSHVHELVEETQYTSNNIAREEPLQENKGEEELSNEGYFRELDGHVPFRKFHILYKMKISILSKSRIFLIHL
jgi:hypothetical protein